MTKLKLLLNSKPQHYRNRIKQRKGSTFWFLFAKVVGIMPSYEPCTDKCLRWQFRNHIFLSQAGRLQTYINKNIPRHLNRKQKRRLARLQLQGI